MSHKDDHKESRRDFLTKIATGSVVGAGILAFAGIIQLPLPKVFNEPSKQFKIGDPEGFPIDTYKIIAEKNVFVLRNGNSFRALSAICTHLGCIVTYSGNTFICPCHGSKFDNLGNVIKGPAPKALEWLKVGLTPGGQLFIDADKKVAYNDALIV